jgi:hypothetical protein
MSGLAVLINSTSWTSAVHVASDSDPQGSLYFHTGMWNELNSGTVSNSGNSPAEEAALMSGSTTSLPEYNNYSTISTSGVPGTIELPADFHHSTEDFSYTFRMPAGATPSPDTASYMSIVQPDGWVLDMIGAVTLSTGNIVCEFASYIDARDTGDGWWQGRRASYLPSFAGALRDGEITSGDIRHALAAIAPPSLLAKEQAIWPAYTFHSNLAASGALPWGALLAIPASADLVGLGLTPQGLTLARAIQDFGVYLVDMGGPGGLAIQAALNASDVTWSGQASDLSIIRDNLHWVSNNSRANPGGGGTPRRPLLPDVQ